MLYAGEQTCIKYQKHKCKYKYQNCKYEYKYPGHKYKYKYRTYNSRSSTTQILEHVQWVVTINTQIGN